MKRTVQVIWALGLSVPVAAALSMLPAAAAAQSGQTIQMVATAYGPSAKDNYPYGATDYFGRPLAAGDVAVDPSVIPLGTHLYISGYNSPYLSAGGFYAVANDTGGAIGGNRVDIFINMPDSQVSNFGIQNVTVTILGSAGAAGNGGSVTQPLGAQGTTQTNAPQQVATTAASGLAPWHHVRWADGTWRWADWRSFVRPTWH